MPSTAMFVLNRNANQVSYIKASLWPYCWWIYCKKSGLEMDFLCEHGDLISSQLAAVN